jgi:hypothetical protein
MGATYLDRAITPAVSKLHLDQIEGEIRIAHSFQSLSIGGVGSIVVALKRRAFSHEPHAARNASATLHGEPRKAQSKSPEHQNGSIDQRSNQETKASMNGSLASLFKSIARSACVTRQDDIGRRAGYHSLNPRNQTHTSSCGRM